MNENTITLAADDKTAAALVATIRAAVNGEGKYVAYVAAHAVTRDNVLDHSKALASLAYPNETARVYLPGTKTRTKWGRAQSAAVNGLRAAMEDEEQTVKPATLRVSLSGEGGGTTVVPADHPMYDALIELLGANQS